MSKIISNYFSLSSIKLFLIIISLSILLFYLSKVLIISENLFYRSYGEQISLNRLKQLWDMTSRFQWINYLLIPPIFLLKSFIISILILGGNMINNYNNYVEFKKIFGIVIASEIVFVLAGFVKFLWFYFSSEYTLQDIQYFYPLSAAQFFRPGELYTWLVYPFQVINVFEIAYLFVLAYGLKIYLKKPLEKMLKLVLSSYGVGLLVWVVFVMFLTLNYS